MKNEYELVVFESSDPEWVDWKTKAREGIKSTIGVASALAITSASAVWLGTLFKLFSSNKMSPYDKKINRQLLTVTSLAAAGGVWHFYRLARQAIDKKRATKMASDFAQHKARISGKKEDVERAEKWKKRSKMALKGK